MYYIPSHIKVSGIYELTQNGKKSTQQIYAFEKKDDVFFSASHLSNPENKMAKHPVLLVKNTAIVNMSKGKSVQVFNHKKEKIGTIKRIKNLF
jgi:hypothetical protein